MSPEDLEATLRRLKAGNGRFGDVAAITEGFEQEARRGGAQVLREAADLWALWDDQDPAAVFMRNTADRLEATT